MKQTTPTLAPLTLAIAMLPLLSACNSDSDSNLTQQPVAQCSIQDQNQRLIDNLRQNYLWNDLLPATMDASSYANPYALLADVVPPIDRFSFMMTTEEYEDRYVNAVFFGLGFGYEVDAAREELRIRYVYENSPAGREGMTRGALLTQVNDIDMATFFSSTLYQQIASGQRSWDAVFGPNEEGAEVYMEWRSPDGQLHDARMAREEVETETVMAVERFALENGDHAGYFVFDSFIQRSAADLNAAFDQLVAAGGVDELVIDLRYNSGGLIAIANQLTSQASWEYVENETFLTFQYNSNYRDESYQFDLAAGIERLNLPRVVVLTTGASCSSSEIVINSLEPFVDVVTVGSPTCGKPVGQSPTEICDKMLFAINFQTVNAEGKGDYFDGLTPTCTAQDRPITDWADPNDPLIGEALYYLNQGQCSNIGSATAWQPSDTPQALFAPVAEQPKGNPLLEKWRQQQ